MWLLACVVVSVVVMVAFFAAGLICSSGCKTNRHEWVYGVRDGVWNGCRECKTCKVFERRRGRDKRVSWVRYE